MLKPRKRSRTQVTSIGSSIAIHVPGQKRVVLSKKAAHELAVKGFAICALGGLIGKRIANEPILTRTVVRYKFANDRKEMKAFFSTRPRNEDVPEGRMPEPRKGLLFTPISSSVSIDPLKPLSADFDGWN